MAKPSFANLKGDFYDRIDKEVTAYAEQVRSSRSLDRDYVPKYHLNYVPREVPAVGFSGIPKATRQAGQTEVTPEAAQDALQELVGVEDGK